MRINKHYTSKCMCAWDIHFMVRVVHHVSIHQCFSVPYAEEDSLSLINISLEKNAMRGAN